MTHTLSATIAGEGRYELGEGILWDDLHRLVRWVDLENGRVLAGTLDDGHITEVSALDLGETVGAVALAGDGGLLVAAARGLATVSPEGVVDIGPPVLGEHSKSRFNDGTVDPQGRFVVGTSPVDGPTGAERLLRFGPGGETETLREGLGLSNGIAFSPDGSTVYHVDSFAGTVSRHSYGTGSFDRREAWLPVVEGLPDYPDGLTVDASGALWLAMWGEGCVRRYSPEGQHLGNVRVNAALATSPAFVGPSLNTLAITTARGADPSSDEAGGLFLVEVPWKGLPSHRWRGSTRNWP